jgi:hypothetical protein
MSTVHYYVLPLVHLMFSMIVDVSIVQSVQVQYYVFPLAHLMFRLDGRKELPMQFVCSDIQRLISKGSTVDTLQTVPVAMYNGSLV